MELYRSGGLTVDLVLGDHGLRHVRRTIERLRKGELQALVCVDMFGEGFDLPQLKVAALHAPYRSLAVTLQFIGRFARTTGEHLGTARFFAVATDMRIERAVLYGDGAAWDLLIPNLSAARVRREREVKEVLSTFGEIEDTATGHQGDQPSRPSTFATAGRREVSDVSLHSLRPYHHIKVLRAPREIEISRPIGFPAHLEVMSSSTPQKVSWPSCRQPRRAVSAPTAVFAASSWTS